MFALFFTTVLMEDRPCGSLSCWAATCTRKAYEKTPAQGSPMKSRACWWRFAVAPNDLMC